MARQRSQRATIAAVLCALATPAAAASATTPGMKIPVPASARVSGTTSTTTATPAPANGAQPGTVAPGSTAPTTSVPTATAPAGTTPTTPGATTPLSTTPTGATGPAAVTPTGTVPGAPSTLVVAGRRAHKSSKGLSGLAIVLAAIGALLVLACLAWALARWLALEPRWTTATMYSLREASNHASTTWAEFSDWARIGR